MKDEYLGFFGKERLFVDEDFFVAVELVIRKASDPVTFIAKALSRKF